MMTDRRWTLPAVLATTLLVTALSGSFSPASEVVAAPPHKCFGKTASIVGTKGNDRLEGTSSDDVIVGLRGKDVIEGSSGKDRICGNGGRDRLKGFRGHDLMRGGSRRDLLNGQSGNDVLRGGRGRDEAQFRPPSVTATPLKPLITANLKAGIAQGRGSDRLSSIEDLEALTLGECCPAVHFVGNGGPNVFQDDYNGGDDLFEGGGGKDTLIVSKHDDTLRGGPGDDQLVFSNGDFLYDGNDQVFGGPGRDWLQLYPPYESGGSTVTNLSKGTSRGPFSEKDKVAGIENVTGGIQNDTLIGDSGRNVLLGQQGSDKLSGGDGRDSLLGGMGMDILKGGLASDKNNGGRGDTDLCRSPDPRSPKSINCER